MAGVVLLAVVVLLLTGRL
ncbi:MAG TPA: hypothetical protein VFW91_04525 [Candidatus Binatia bacterium]|nr:hypothetical protein [Candidatus Binatia bacterium]